MFTSVSVRVCVCVCVCVCVEGDCGYRIVTCVGVFVDTVSGGMGSGYFLI